MVAQIGQKILHRISKPLRSIINYKYNATVAHQ
jgi:hypothetical protein